MARLAGDLGLEPVEGCTIEFLIWGAIREAVSN
jgi:hypothetical protein